MLVNMRLTRKNSTILYNLLLFHIFFHNYSGIIKFELKGVIFI
jgi:hypothetical protein